MEHVLQLNHLKEVGVGDLWFSVPVVDDHQPHNDGHQSSQEYENDYENTGKSNEATKFCCGMEVTNQVMITML